MWVFASMLVARVVGDLSIAAAIALGWNDRGTAALVAKPMFYFCLTSGAAVLWYGLGNRIARPYLRDETLGSWFVRLNKETIYS